MCIKCFKGKPLLAGLVRNLVDTASRTPVPEAVGSFDNLAFREVFDAVLDFASAQIAEQTNLADAQDA